MKNIDFDNSAAIFKALSHPIRVRIVAGLIKKEECNVSKMVENLKIPQPTVSQHLIILKSQGIIKGSRKANQICYSVVNEDVKQIFKALEYL